MQILGFLFAALLLTTQSSGVEITSPSDSVAYEQYEAESERVFLKVLDHFEVEDLGYGDEEGQAEYFYYNSDMHQMWVVNSGYAHVDVYNLTSEAMIVYDSTLYVNGTPNSVVYNPVDRVFAVAVAANPQTDPGTLMIFDAESKASIANVTTANPMPDHVSFGPSFKCLYSANEGEPENGVNPYGGVTQVCASNFRDISTYQVSHSNLADLNITNIPEGAHDPSDPLNNSKTIDDFISYIEPEFITYSEAAADGSYEVYVICQEANLFLVYVGNTESMPNLSSEPTRIIPLGFKDHSLESNSLDIVNDDIISLVSYKGLKGIYQPDTVKAVTQDGTTYIIAANEGDQTLVEEDAGLKYSDMTFVAGTFDDPVPDALTNLKKRSVGNKNLAGEYDALYMNGGRSFLVLDSASGEIVFDSGNQLANKTAEFAEPFFNINDGELLEGEDRSTKKGAEVESLAVAHLDGLNLLFVGLERPGLIAVMNITDVTKPSFHSLNAVIDSCSDSTARLADPEALQFIPAAEAPNGKNLLIASGSVSSTLTVFEVVITTGLSDVSDLNVCTRAANGDPSSEELSESIGNPTSSPSPASSIAASVLTPAFILLSTIL